MRSIRVPAVLAAGLLAATVLVPAAAAAPSGVGAADAVPDPVHRASVEHLPVRGLTPQENRELLTDVKASQAGGLLRADGWQQPDPMLTTELPPANPGPEPVRDYTADELVGTVKRWLALDINAGAFYLKDFRLAAVGDHIEVWVAVGDNARYHSDADVYTLPFPEGDCRNTTYDGARVEVTPAQINQLVADFDQNMYPLETEYFRTPPPRNGEQAVLPAQIDELPNDYYSVPGGADRTVTLIDNVRDDNYLTPPDKDNLSYIAGFFSSTLNTFFDRNTMTIDAWDWLHRTGANPPDDSSEDPCLAAPARPFLYESVFAHEWQHLLQSYTGEVTWLNEGLSDWAQTLTGYADPALPITDPQYDSHVQCFLGFLAEQTPANLIPSEDSGPENSLTWWEDQGSGEVLCDYGAAYTMVEYLVGQFGVGAGIFLHNDPATGLGSVANLLAAADDPRSALDILHDWAAMVAIDGALDANDYRLFGGDPYRFQTPTLNASIRWEGDDAYDTPGAPPNGSDYVRLRDATGEPFAGRALERLTFTGAAEYEPAPVEWTVTDPGGNRLENEALFSGSGNALDRTMAFEASVPADDPTLTFETQFDIEYRWDFGFVQVSTDGGETWTSVADELTLDEAEENPDYPEIAANLPGLTGTSRLTQQGDPTVVPETGDPDWVTAAFDLADYAGQDVLIGFRYLTDGAAVQPGWWVDDIRLGGVLVNDGTTTEGLFSYKQLQPDDVAGWVVQLVGIDSDGSPRLPARLGRFEVAPGETLTLGSSRLLAIGVGSEVIGAIVTLDEPTESVLQYAPYTLTVNGVTQPGGG